MSRILLGAILIAVIGFGAYHVYQDSRTPTDKAEDAIEDFADDVGDAARDANDAVNDAVEELSQ